MKLKNQPITILFLLISTCIFGQKNQATNVNLEEFSVDTIYSVDTINLAPDPNSIILSKNYYDSLLNALKTQEENKKTSKTTSKKAYRLFNRFELCIADYQNIGIKSGIEYKDYRLNINAGVNFNDNLPIIAGISIGKKIRLLEKINFEPEIASLWYIATQNSYSPQHNIHLLLGFEYQLTSKFALAISPSIYCGWRNNVKNNREYNDVAHMISPNIPFYADEIGENSTFDIGYGISATASYKINND